MSQTMKVELVEKTMMDFAKITGLEPISQTPNRYLWTDAFAVCNFLELFHQTKKDIYLDLAQRLVSQVHHTLGRHRRDDARMGWISGLDENEGEKHPTIGGLRIGKKFNERTANEPADPVREWEQDGQYYHYLTKWMHALERIGSVTQEVKYIKWAVELAKKAESDFVYYDSSIGSRRMYWKMSIDLSHPQVYSMGQHDSLDGFVTYSELQLASKGRLQEDLDDQIYEISKVCGAVDWATDDPLGIGGLLFDAYRTGQLMVNGYNYQSLLEKVLESSSQSLGYFTSAELLRLPAIYRLPFRELGLSIGLRAVDRLGNLVEDDNGNLKTKTRIKKYVREMKKNSSLADEIERYWSNQGNQEISTWVEHREINMVMLATSLASGEFLSI